jgi:hypothetical protein
VIFRKFADKIADLTLGSSAVKSIIAKEGRVSLKNYYKTLLRKKMLAGVFKESKTQLKSEPEVYSENLSPVTSPLALISQIQRSGGSLLSQLFDGHPEIHAHPHEIMIGYPRKHIWPRIDLNDSPERWFEILFEDMVIQHSREGYKKERTQRETFPFIFLPSLQRKIFLKYTDPAQSMKLRGVFDAYMTSYFGAWLSNQNSNGQKKFVTAFTPRLAMTKENMKLFFEIYPDGRLISLIRDPKNWYPSARRHSPKKYGDIEGALSQWKESAQAMHRNKRRYGERVCLIKFEDLIGKTEPVMRYLANFLGIEFDNILLIPTFNKFPIRANTTFKVEDQDIINSPLSRYKALTEEELDTIERVTSETYQLVLNRVDRFE